jgi:hypothetical protein
MTYSPDGFLITLITSAQNVFVVNGSMFVKKSLSVTRSVLPATNATKSANLLPRSNAAVWTKLLTSAMAVQNKNPNALSRINMSIMQSLPNASTKNSGQAQGKV